MIADLTNHVWQSTVFAAAAVLLASLLRQNRAQVRYWVWFAASLKFLVPFSLLTGLGGRLGSTPRVHEIGTTAPVVSLALERIAQPFSSVFPAATAWPHGIEDWTAVVALGLWVCGFAAVALSRMSGWRRIRAGVRVSTPARIPVLDRHGHVQVRCSPHLMEPGVVGLWRPIVLVPAGVEERLTPSQLEAVLEHEFCHVRRRDNLTAAIHMIVEAVFWFHPLVWWIGARLEEARERACDEHVLTTLPDPQPYAEGILNVCKLYVESPLACVSGVTGSPLKKRIEDIMISRIGLRLTNARKAILGLFATLALAVPIFVGMTTPLPAQSVSSQAAGSASQPRTSDPVALVETKEVVLKYALFQIREALDRYHADNDRDPRSWESLVNGGYIAQIPTDPFTNRVDSWLAIASAPNPNDPAIAPAGIRDVRSGSDATALNGTKYSDW